MYLKMKTVNRATRFFLVPRNEAEKPEASADGKAHANNLSIQHNKKRR